MLINVGYPHQWNYWKNIYIYKLWWSRVDGNRVMWKVETNVGQFSFFCENQLVSILTLCYENLIGSLIYNFFGGW